MAWSSGRCYALCMKTERPADTLVPPDLLREIEAAAEEEHRAPSELVGEAVERYLSELVP